jgi:tRNA threonylcarbamoyl adenosine modification protein YeaZ
VVAERGNVDARAHGELLAPAIEECLAEAGIGPSALFAVVAGVGPGPFTGLRVGLVTASAFADALRVPAYGVCSLDAIAAGVHTGGVHTAAVHSAGVDAAGVHTADVHTAGTLLVAGDARRKEVYWASYSGGVRQSGPAVNKPGDLPGTADAMAGAGARLYRDVLGLPLLEHDYPSVVGLAALASDRVRTRAPSEALIPLYLRRPDVAEPSPPKVVTA